MNNKSQSILFGVIAGIFLFIVGMVFLNFITPETWIDGEDSMMTEIGCGTIVNDTITGNDSITSGTKVTCLIGEIVIPYFIIIVIASAGGLIVARFLL